jgi:hypothetical protein
MTWSSRKKDCELRKAHDKLSSISERSETVTSIFEDQSNSGQERPNPDSVDSQIFSPLGTLSLEIPVEEVFPGIYKGTSDRLLPSNTIRIEFRIIVSVIASHPERIRFGDSGID